jgi:hypothetical protein
MEWKKLQQAQALGSEQKRMTLFWNAVRTAEPIACLDLCIESSAPAAVLRWMSGLITGPAVACSLGYAAPYLCHPLAPPMPKRWSF